MESNSEEEKSKKKLSSKEKKAPNSKSASKAKSKKKVAGKKKSVKKKIKSKSKKIVRKPRGPSLYNRVQKSVAQWCRDNGSKCTQKEIAETYQAVKLRYMGDVKVAFNPDKFQSEIAKILSNKGKSTIPDDFLGPFPWYDSPSLFNQDGLFFNPKDILRFDLTSINGPEIEMNYDEFNDIYSDDIYVRIYEFQKELRQTNKSFYLLFVYDEDASDEDRRIYTWNLKMDTDESPEGSEQPTEVTSEKIIKVTGDEEFAKQKESENQFREREIAIEEKKLQTEQIKNDIELVKLKLMDPEVFKKKWADYLAGK